MVQTSPRQNPARGHDQNRRQGVVMMLFVTQDFRREMSSDEPGLMDKHSRALMAVSKAGL
jgi:hypothetical protein